jgi:hypothetical protein
MSEKFGLHALIPNPGCYDDQTDCVLLWLIIAGIIRVTPKPVLEF